MPWVVMHKGRVVYERYDNQMKPYTPHLLFSVTKSFTGPHGGCSWRTRARSTPRRW